MKQVGGQEKRAYVGAMFARIVPRYDLINTLMTFGRHAAWRATTVRLAAPPPGGLALDVAAGTGDLAIALASSHGQLRVLAVDFCAEMLWVARQKAATRGIDGQMWCVLGDALTLPFPGYTFHCATMGFALRNVADIRQSLTEIHRVLRRGGRFANLELTPPPPGPRASLFWLYFHRLVPLLGGILSGDREAYTYLPNSLRSFPPAADLAALMREVGFEDVSYRRLAAGTIAVHFGMKS